MQRLSLKVLLGQTINEVVISGDEYILFTDEGNCYLMNNDGGWVDRVEGDVIDLLGNPIVAANQSRMWDDTLVTIVPQGSPGISIVWAGDMVGLYEVDGEQYKDA